MLTRSFPFGSTRIVQLWLLPWVLRRAWLTSASPLSVNAWSRTAVA